tara:strand:+ start:17838 stop:18929 length:1092 start_codon:yes stop_codon:yes gene_type:complete
MKNVILVYPAYERGGVKINFINYVNILKKNKFNIFIISDKKILTDFKPGQKTKIVLVKSSKVSFFYKYFTSLLSSLEIFKITRKLKDKNIRVISFQSSFFSSLVCAVLNLKLIIRVSEDPIGATIHTDNYFLGLIVILSKIITYNLSYKIFANSRQMQSSIKKFTINKKKIILQYNMNLKFIRKFKVSNKKNIFLSLGRFCKQKNQLIILSAFKLFTNRNKNHKHKLYLCGDGPDKNKLMKLCKMLKLNKYVKFYGWQKSTINLYKKSKYFIMPSLYEGLPNALIDAVNYNLLPLCSSISGVKDICGNSYVVLKKNDPNDICSNMEYAKKNYKTLIKKNRLNKKILKKFLLINFNTQLLNNIK